MNDDDRRWTPSRLEQRGLWYLQTVMRFVVGGGGLVWTAAHGLNPLALLVFGTLATSTDVFGFVRALIRQAREETLRLDEELKRGVADDDADTGS